MLSHLLSNREKTAHKVYLALVAGIPSWQEITVDAAIGRHEVEQCARACVLEGGQDALTKFKVIETVPEADLSAGTPAAYALPGVENLKKYVLCYLRLREKAIHIIC